MKTIKLQGFPGGEQVRLKDGPFGEPLKRKEHAKKVYLRGEYDRQYCAYRIDDVDDCSRDMLVPGHTLVWIGFDY